MFDEVIGVLPPHLKNPLSYISADIKNDTYEIRIRKDRPLVLSGKYGTLFVNENSVASSMDRKSGISAAGEDIDMIVSAVCGYSVYSHQSDIANGFVTFGKGHRAGLCGTAVMNGNEIASVRDITSVNLRVARDFPDCADNLLREISGNGKFGGLILAGAPCTGKTTVLKSLAYLLSSEYNYGFRKTAVIDERYEMDGIRGINCDILSGYPKEDGIIHAMRSLSPEIIICDEVTTVSEAEKITKSLASGIKFAVSVHAGSISELLKRPAARRLLDSGGFEYTAVLKSSSEPSEFARIIKTEELKNEIGFDNSYYGKLIYSGVSDYQSREYALP